MQCEGNGHTAAPIHSPGNRRHECQQKSAGKATKKKRKSEKKGTDLFTPTRPPLSTQFYTFADQLRNFLDKPSVARKLSTL